MLFDWRICVDQEIRDTAAILSQDEKDQAVTEAVKVYSRHRPRERAHEISGDGAAYQWVMPTDWEDGFSAIKPDTVEYPANQRDPEYLEREDWIIYRDPTLGLRFRLINDTPTAADKVRFLYTVRHTVSEAADTVPVADREPAAKLAASFCARMLAAHYAQTQDASLGDAAVNYRTKSQEYTSLAEKLERLFKQHLGIREDGSVPAASASADIDVDLQPGGDRFFHPRRWR